MKGVALYQTPGDRPWCLVEIPDGWHRADPLPTDKTSETLFDTKEVAIIAPVPTRNSVGTGGASDGVTSRFANAPPDPERAVRHL
jgi:hypothetical protein